MSAFDITRPNKDIMNKEYAHKEYAPAYLVGHFLSPADEEGRDGPAFVCTNAGTARDFGSVSAAVQHIADYDLNDRAPIWSVFVLTEVKA